MAHRRPNTSDAGPSLAFALAGSVVLHALAAIALSALAWQSGEFAPPDAASAERAWLQPPEELRPGIEFSEQVSITWLGFAEPVPHEAPQSDVEQAALSPEAHGVLDPASTSPPVVAAPEQVTLADAAPSSDSPPEPAAPEPVALADTAPSSFLPPLDPGTPEETLVQLTDTPSPDAAPLASPPFDPANQAPPLGAETPEPRPEQPAPHSPPADTPEPVGDPEAAPGAIRSAKESDPTAFRRPVTVDPGKPVAAQGLDITTVRPRWTLATRLISSPRNPLVRVWFRRDGRVGKASFAPGASTGVEGVDGPLLDAVYRWRAKGKALDELPSDDPEAMAFMEFRVLLNPRTGPINRSSTGR